MDSKQTQAYIRKDKRRAMVADAALALILENGYAALRTRDVAKRVGISVSTLHFHVPTKAALVELIAETMRDRFLSLLPPPPNAALPARAQLRAEVEAYHASLRDHPELAAGFTQLSQVANNEPSVTTILEAFTQGWLQRYVEILELGRQQGTFRQNLEPLPAAIAITGALTAFGVQQFTDLAMFWPVFKELETGLLAAQEKGERP